VADSGVAFGSTLAGSVGACCQRRLTIAHTDAVAGTRRLRPHQRPPHRTDRTPALDHIGEGIRSTPSVPASRHPRLLPTRRESNERDARIGHQIPLGRVGTLSEITDAVLYLASPQASFLVGTDLVVDGGSTT